MAEPQERRQFILDLDLTSSGHLSFFPARNQAWVLMGGAGGWLGGEGAWSDKGVTQQVTLCLSLLTLEYTGLEKEEEKIWCFHQCKVSVLLNVPGPSRGIEVQQKAVPFLVLKQNLN